LRRGRRAPRARARGAALRTSEAPLKRALVLASAVGVAVALAASTASAQAHIPANDWRQQDRPYGRERYETPTSFAVELRFGPYYPEVDEEFEGKAGTPYKDVFGDSAQFYFGLEFD